MHNSAYIKMGLTTVLFHGLLLVIGIVFSSPAIELQLHTLSSGRIVEIDAIIPARNQVIKPLAKTSSITSPMLNGSELRDGFDRAEQNQEVASQKGSISMPSAEALALSNPHPPYPISSRENGEEGRVTLNACISELGMVDYVELVNSSGYGALDRSAMNTVRKWKFIAAQRFGIPIPMCYRLPINFILAS